MLFDCSGYTSIEPIRDLTGLTSLCLEGGFSKPIRLASIEAVGSLLSLCRLRLASLRVSDRSLSPLRSLANLRDVFIADAFPAAEFRALARALPLARGQFLDSYRDAG